jgi:hypothetical protein
MYNRVHPYQLADIKGASAARRVATTNGGKGSQEMNGPNTVLEL